MAYQRDLVHRGGPPLSRHQIQSQYPFHDYDGGGSSPPRAPEGRYRGQEEWYPSSRGPRPRPSHHREEPHISFEDALADLFDLLNESLTFYSKFKREFDDEVQGVAAYAGPVLLKELWVSRVDSLGGGQNSHDPRDRQSARDRSQTPQSFKHTYLRLKGKFEAAIRAAPSWRPKRAGHDEGRGAGYERILQKLGAGHRDISRLAQSARTRSGEVEALVMELEFLIAYLEKNKGVWHGGEGGEDGRYDEQGDGGPEGQEACGSGW